MEFIDDALVFANAENLKMILAEIKKLMPITQAARLKEYIGCTILKDDKLKRAVIHQGRLIKTLTKFGEGEKSYRTPAGPGTRLSKAESPTLIGDKEHSEYRTNVGKLLFLLKHLRPDMGNAIRELSKTLDNTETIHFKAMQQAVNFVLETKQLGLKIEPDEEEEQLKGVTDTTFASEQETRRSVTGWLIFFYGVLISWKSRVQKNVTLSSTESEYVGLSKMVCEIIFAKQVLESVVIKVKLPIPVCTDNTGAIHLTKNWLSGGKTKHVDTRYHFIKELQDQGVIVVKFVGTKENEANMMTKNVGEQEYNRMTDKNLIDIQRFDG